MGIFIILCILVLGWLNSRCQEAAKIERERELGIRR